MAYTSRAYERKWTYETSEDTFDSRVGKILAGGLDLKESLREKALAQLAANREAEAAHERREAEAAAAMMHVNGPTGGTGGKNGTQGYVWVDPKGRTLGPVGPQDQQPAAAGPGSSGEPGSGLWSSRGPRLTERQQAAMAMNTTERSMNLWKKLNPGCVEETNRTPNSTFKDHYGPKHDLPETDKQGKAYNFRKTDFSEYTEVKLRLMNHLKSGSS